MRSLRQDLTAKKTSATGAGGKRKASEATESTSFFHFFSTKKSDLETEMAQYLFEDFWRRAFDYYQGVRETAYGTPRRALMPLAKLTPDPSRLRSLSLAAGRCGQVEQDDDDDVLGAYDETTGEYVEGDLEDEDDEDDEEDGDDE